MDANQDFVFVDDLAYERFASYSDAVEQISTEGAEEFTAIKVPSSLKDRYAFSARLMALFKTEWINRDSKLVPGSLAYQDEYLYEAYNGRRPASDFIFKEDLVVIMRSLRGVLPGVQDKDFIHAVRSRTSGVFRAMQLLVKLHSTRCDTEVVVRLSDQMSRPINYVGAGNLLPRELPYTERTAHMSENVRRLKQVAEDLPALEDRNRQLFTTISNSEVPTSLRHYLIRIRTVYASKIDGMVGDIEAITPEMLVAQWWNVLLNKLGRLVSSNKQNEDILKEILIIFVDELERAQTRDQFVSIINKLT